MKVEHLDKTNFTSTISQWLVVIDYFAEWCGPCKMIAPFLEQLADQYADKISFYKLDVDNEFEIAWTQWIRAMPTLQFFYNGEKVDEVVWADINLIMTKVALLSQKNAAQA